MEYPRILIISHTSFTKADSMGSTLASYFETYDPNCIAQFYIKKMMPDIPICKKYFCVTDNELLYKLLHPIKGEIGKIIDIENDSISGKAAEASSIGSHKHRDITMLARKILWSTKLWNNRRFKEWLYSFSPQVILVQPGDFSYLLDIGVGISKKLQIPIVVHQSESYYLKEYEKKTLLYKLFRYDFKKSYEKLMKYTSYCIYLCDALEKDYSQFFSIPSATIMKATSIKPELNKKEFNKNDLRFIYGGNLGETVGRCEPLLELGIVIKKLGFQIDVYTSSTGEHMNMLNPDNGIKLHGSLSYEELQKQIKNSDFVIHVESQKSWNIRDLKYAFSTKIADMLASGVCSIVYGSNEIASVMYFKNYKLGCVIERKEDIEPLITELINCQSKQKDYINRALDQAIKEHNPNINSERMRKIIVKACEKGFYKNW